MNILHLLTTVAIVVVIALVIVAVYKRLGDKSRQLAQLAEKLGLPVMNDERGPFGGHRAMAFILDVWRGREVNIHHIVRMVGRTQTYSAAIDMPVKVSPELRMTFTSKNVLTQAAMQPGLEAVATGEAEFDNSIYVKSSDTALAKTLINPALAALFVRTWAAYEVGETLSVREGRIHYEEPSWIDSAEMRDRFAAIVSVSHDLAEALDKAAGAQPQPPEAK
jgi:hypothetical protein